ncbi:GSCOCG00010312001-RA-CDS [Cotesia congregata]|nr:GSCOCG00010312001-RA-CDS [Cotesia congregata]
MQKYQTEMELCKKIPSIKTALINFTTQALKSYFQRYVIDVFDTRVSTFCRRRCITTELRAINRRFIKNLDGLDELMGPMIADWHEFQEKCELKSTTTTSTTITPTTTSTTTPAPIIIPPYHRSRPHPSDDDCWGILDIFKHHNYFD